MKPKRGRPGLHQGPFQLPKGHEPPDGVAYEWVLVGKVAEARAKGWKPVPQWRHRVFHFSVEQGGFRLMQRKAISISLKQPREDGDVVAPRSRQG